MAERGRRRPAARSPGAAEDETAGAAEALAVMLDAGLAPAAAWTFVGEQSADPVIARIGSAVAAGTLPADAVAAAAVRGKDGGLRALAAAWSVADAAGAPLAPALRGTADSLRDRAETLREIDAALSGPRATARLMGWLPLAGLGMAALLGIDVLGALLGSTPGWALLGLGGSLSLLGALWTRTLVRRAHPSPDVAGAGADLLAIALGGGLSVDAARSLVRRVSDPQGADAIDSAGVDRTVRIAERAGVPVVELLVAAARQDRRTARADGRRAAATLAVRLLVPLGVCVLPAFLLLGVAPVVLAIVSSTFTSLR